jgi:hypothetical protein
MRRPKNSPAYEDAVVAAHALVAALASSRPCCDHRTWEDSCPRCMIAHALPGLQYLAEHAVLILDSNCLWHTSPRLKRRLARHVSASHAS